MKNNEWFVLDCLAWIIFTVVGVIVVNGLIDFVVYLNK